MEWFFANKEWFFSGIGCIIITFIVSFVIWLFKKKNAEKGVIQNQSSGDNSTNYQSGNDIHIGK